VAIRHVPYGDLSSQVSMRFAEISDLTKHNCTVRRWRSSSRVARGNVIYCGVDCAEILRSAENDPSGCDVISGTAATTTSRSAGLMVTVVGPLRAGHELTYWPSAVTLRVADAVVINKTTARPRRDRHGSQEHRGSRPEGHGHRRGLAAHG
jgi:predicted GTPase